MAEAEWNPKREARQFEVPPWEREQFEVLQKRREPEAPAELAAEEEPGEPLVQPVATVPKAEAAKPEALPIPEAELVAMLAQLHSEEPKVDEHLKSVTVFASAIAMLLGVSMFAWGLFAMVSAKKTPATVVGALIVVVMGAAFGGIGLWAGWRVTNK